MSEADPEVKVMLPMPDAYLHIYSLVFIVFGVWAEKPDGEFNLTPPPGLLGAAQRPRANQHAARARPERPSPTALTPA